MMNKDRIAKLVIKAGDIDTKDGWRLSSNENLISCPDCLSHLCYVKINYGIVAEDFEIMVSGNRGKTTYGLREIGFVTFCAECGGYIENYFKYFYPEDKVVFSDWHLGELDDYERAEMEACLHQFNQTGKFEPRFSSIIFTQAKEALIEYEKKHPIWSGTNGCGGHKLLTRTRKKRV